jgi:pectinesterase
MRACVAVRVAAGLALAAPVLFPSAGAAEMTHPFAAAPGKVIVVPGGAYPSLQAAVDGLSERGGEIRLGPGVYREKVLITKPNVTLRGTGRKANDVVIAWADGAKEVGGTFRTATLEIRGDDFHAENLTVANDHWLRSENPTQAVALYITGDRAVVENVRMLGSQDTLYAASRRCEGPDCRISRQYFRDCYVEGHVDFIFGNSKAFFENCELHAIPHDEVMLTAHMRTGPDEDRAYVFDHCRITSEPGVGTLWFGRPWRDYSRVIFLNTRIDAALHPDGWREWTPGTTNRLTTAFYAEFGSTGSGAPRGAREPYSSQLSAVEAERWSAEHLLAGDDGWAPQKKRRGKLP